MTYTAKINFVDVTSFNYKMEDWSGELYTTDINDTIYGDTLEQLYTEVASWFGTTSEDFQQDFDNETGIYTVVGEGKLYEYNIPIYEIKGLTSSI